MSVPESGDPQESQVPKRYWTNRLGRPEDVEACVALMRTVHGDRYPELDRAFWEWRYLSNPDFPADIIIAEHEGHLIGVRMTVFFHFQWGEARLRGAIHGGSLTHPDHRRQGVYRSLMDSSNERLAARDAHISFVMPNEFSGKALSKSDEWRYPGLIPLHLKVIDGQTMLTPKVGHVVGRSVGWVAELLCRRRPLPASAGSLSMELATQVPEEIDDLFDEFSRDCGTLMIRRTAAYWNWRYGAKPFGDYHILIARRAGVPVGAVATSVQRRAGLEVGMMMDFVVRGGLTALRQLMREAEAELRERGLGLVTCQATSPMLRRALEEEGYWCAPPRLIRKRFHFFYRLTGVPGLPGDPARLQDWHLTFGDSDNA